NLAATVSCGTQVNLTWTASTSGAGILKYSFEQWQCDVCTSFVQIGTATATSYSDAGLTSATSYSYRVRATDVNNTVGGYSNTAKIGRAAWRERAELTVLAATANGKEVNLTWAE